MLYHLFQYLSQNFDFPGSALFSFISFRAGMAIITSLVITLLFGGKLIKLLHKKQVGETIRDLGLDGQMQKSGTPTMGGVIILAGILVPTLLFAKLDNVYIQLMIISTIWLGTIGFIDDYIKVFKKNKKGLAGKFKVIGQIGVGLIVGITMYLSDDVTNLNTTIPFIKNNEFDYAWLLTWISDDLAQYVWLIFIPLVVIIVTAVSNGANITDGLDGLLSGCSVLIFTGLAITILIDNPNNSTCMGMLNYALSTEFQYDVKDETNKKDSVLSMLYNFFKAI